MAKPNKFEQLVEYIINEDEAKAKALFHQIVVEKSRNIYESLVDEDQFPVQRGRGAESLSNEIEDHSDTIDGDEHGMHEAEDDFGDEDSDTFGDDDSGFGDEDGDEFSDDDADLGGDSFDTNNDGEIETRVMDLEDAIDELKAEFDQLMAGEEHEEEEFPGIHGEEGIDGDSDDEFDTDDNGEGGEELGDEAEIEGKKFGEASIYGESKEDKKAKDEKAKKDAKAKKEKDVKESRKSPADLMREYVEKVTAVKPVEGDEVGAASEKVNVNKKSTQISGKNDMGGTTANIARGGAEQAADGKPVPKPSNAYTKGQGNLPGADKFENRPGAKAGQTFKKASKPASKEGSPAGSKNTMGGTVSDKSIEPGGKPGFKG